MAKKQTGFTIVELLIVIVVIAILAAISIVAYNGIQARAKNTSRLAVGAQWVRTFQLYQAQNGTMPPALASAALATKFCLGTGFPVGGGGVPRCQNVTGTDSNSPAESDNAALMSQLQTVTDIPTTAPIRSAATITGPWVRKPSESVAEIHIVLDGSWALGAECGGGFRSVWTNNVNATTCMKAVNF